MKNIAKKIGAASAYPEAVNVEPANLNGPQVGPEVNDKHPQSARQEGTMSPAPISSLPTPADQLASTGIDATYPTSLNVAPKDPKGLEKSAVDGISSTSTNHIPGATANRFLQVPPAETVSPEQRKPNRKNLNRSTGPTSKAGKARSSQNSYKEGHYARRLYPTAKQWAEDGEDYRKISIALHEHYKPVDAWEGFWVEKIATETIREARGIGFQQRTLGSEYRFWGTSLNTSERHVSSAHKRLHQAIKMLEDIQAKRLANSGQPQPTDPKSEQVSKTSNHAGPFPMQSSETVAGPTDVTEQQHADSGDPGDAIDVGRSDDEQDGYSFLYDGPPPDRDVVSPSQSGQQAVSAGQSTENGGTNPKASPQFDPRAGRIREDTSEPPHMLADIVYKVIGWDKNGGTNSPLPQPQPRPQASPGSVSQAETVSQRHKPEVKDRSNERNSKPEPVPSVARIENVETNSKTPGKDFIQSDFKKDSK
jgi:hypothetical protein